MALTTKQEIVDEIRYQLYGGMPSNTAAISSQFVLRLLNDRIAESAIKSAFGTYNLDGCVCADDIFTLSYSNLILLTDINNGLKYFELPTQPIGLPSNRAFNIYPPNMRGGIQSSVFKPISRSEVTYVRSMPGIKKVFHFVTNGRMYFVDNYLITSTYSSVNADIITSGANDIISFLNLPDDLIATCKALVLNDLRPMLQLQDITPMPPQDSPQPR